MNLWLYIDGYCERLEPGFWNEPVNAVSNLAFLLAALIMAHRLRGAGLPLARGMVWILAIISLGSFLFHTFATVWASVADVGPIMAFILLYVFASVQDYMRLGRIWAMLSVPLFFFYTALGVQFTQYIPGIGSSAEYAVIPPLILFFAAFVWRHNRATGRGLVIGALLLTLSIGFRSLDLANCAANPLGTHFIWHILNAIMLAWMIEVYRRHMVAAPPPER